MSLQLSPQEEFAVTVQRVSALVREFELLPYPQLRDRAAALLQAIDALHRQPLRRLVCLIEEHERDGLLERLSDDPLVRQLLLLYDLIPSDEVAQVEAALYPFWPNVQAHGGDMEVLGVADGTVRIRLTGTCQGCARSSEALRRTIEEALRDELPGFKGLWLEGIELAPSSDRAAADPPHDECVPHPKRE